MTPLVQREEVVAVHPVAIFHQWLVGVILAAISLVTAAQALSIHAQVTHAHTHHRYMYYMQLLRMSPELTKQGIFSYIITKT